YRRAGLFQPIELVALQEGADLAQNARVIGIEPGQLLRIEQARLDEPAVDRTERQRLERHHRAFAARDRLGLAHQDEILDANAILAFLVIAGLVGEDHA